MNDLSLPLYLWVALAPLVGAFLGAYVKRRAEDVAMNANFQNVLDQLKRQTEETENIKAAISDDVWDRQEQWKMKRDSILSAVLALHEMENALVELNSCFTVPPELCDQSARERQKGIQQEALTRFRDSSTAYQSAMLTIDLVVGIQLSKALSNYFQFACPLAVKIMTERKAVIESEANKQRAEMSKAVIKSAREVLGIRDAGEIALYQTADAR